MKNRKHAGKQENTLCFPPDCQKVRNRQNRFTIQWIFALWILFAKVGYSKLYSLKTSLLRKDFDLLRNSRPTVPMYADERELLVFRTFSQSVSVPKRVFRHAEICLRIFRRQIFFDGPGERKSPALVPF